MQETGHPAFATMDEWLGDIAASMDAYMRGLLKQHLDATVNRDIDCIVDYTYAGDVSKTGATLKFEFEVYLTPDD